MHLLDLTLPTPAENLALDEALLDAAESTADETLRFWEPPQPVIVVGRSSRIEFEVQLLAARARRVPILRRCSGGAAIVSGPGCLMYAVVLNLERRPRLRQINLAHRFVLTQLQVALAGLGIAADARGDSDLAIDGRKCSGNSCRIKRNRLLYHGTLMCKSFAIDLIPQLLGVPPRQPDYREQRSHADFVEALPVDVKAVREAAAAAWQVEGKLTDWPAALTAELVAARYSQLDWNLGLGSFNVG